MMTADKTARGSRLHDRKQNGQHQQDRAGVHQNRQRRAATKSAIRQAGADIDSAGDAAETGGDDIAKSEPDQEPVRMHPGVAWLAHQLGTKQCVDRRDGRKSQSAAQHGRPKLEQGAVLHQLAEICQRRVTERVFRRGADHWPETIAQPEGDQEIVDDGSRGKADEQRRNFRRNPARVPHQREGQRGEQNAERLDLAGMGQDEGERPDLVATGHVGQLDQEQECRRRGLETSHDRMRRVSEQSADFEQAEKRLENTAQKNHRKEDDEHQHRAMGLQHGGLGVD